MKEVIEINEKPLADLYYVFMKRILSAFLILLVFTFVWYLFFENRTKEFSLPDQQASVNEKVYVALEEEGKIAVLNQEKVIKKISLDSQVSGMKVPYMAHNVQVAPDGKSVWVTANAGSGGHEEMETMDVHGNAQDEVIVIDPKADTIVKRVSLGSYLNLAHVVLSPDSSYAYITAQSKDLVFKVNARTFEVENTIEFEKESGPHGLRFSPDGKIVYVALSTGKGIGVVEFDNGNVTYIPLKGQGIQTGVTPDGKYVVVSVFDAKSLGVYETSSKELSYISLPKDAKGPLQVYAAPDSRYVYLADQGNYFGQPDNNKVYKIDLNLHKVISTVTVGTAPHAVSKDGKRVYVTNLISGDLSIIDAQRGSEINRVKVGDHPNGVSVWSSEAGGTP